MKYAAHRRAVSRVDCCGFPHPLLRRHTSGKPRGPGRGAGAALWACCTRPPTASADSRARRRGAGARSRSTSTVARCTGRSTRCTPPWSAESGSRCGWPTGNATGTPRCGARRSGSSAEPASRASRGCRSRGSCPSRSMRTASSCTAPSEPAMTRGGRTTSGWRCSTPSSSPMRVPRDPGPSSGPDAVLPPALVVHRIDAAVRHGRETWWAEVSPREEYRPRCSCCPLLFGRVSEGHDRDGGGPTMPSRPVGLAYATSYLVALDVETGVCMHVEHLDGDHAGRGFSVDIRCVVTAGDRRASSCSPDDCTPTSSGNVSGGGSGRGPFRCSRPKLPASLPGPTADVRRRTDNRGQTTGTTHAQPPTARVRYVRPWKHPQRRTAPSSGIPAGPARSAARTAGRAVSPRRPGPSRRAARRRRAPPPAARAPGSPTGRTRSPRRRPGWPRAGRCPRRRRR